MFSINPFRVVILAGVCLFSAVAMRAQTSSAAPAGPKVGTINMMQAIGSTAEGKQAAAELQSQFSARQQELDSLGKQINDIQQRLNSQTLGNDERDRLTVQGNRLSQIMDRKKSEFQDDVNAAQGEAINNIGGKMIEILKRYATEQNYVEILDSSSQNSSLLYASKNIDITQDIIRLYDQAHPLKSASAAPPAKPTSAPKPPAASASSASKPR